MNRRSTRAFLIAAPATVGGSLVAHGVAYRLAVPDAKERSRILAGTGHAYLANLSVPGALLLSLLLVGLVLAVADAARGRAARRIRAWPFALMPALGFTLQEHLERFAHTGSLAVHERPFLVGLAVQVPLGLLVFFVVRGLVAASVRLGRALRFRRRRRRLRPAASVRPTAPLVATVRRAVLAYAESERGPPAPALA